MATDYPPRASAAVPPRRRPLGPVAAFVLMAATVAATSSLGAWQLSRAHQKQVLQSRLDERSALPPLDVAGLARTDEAATAQYDRRVVLTGHWLASSMQLLDNRPMDDRIGFDVVTPLRTPGGRVVVVVRGWVARDGVDPRRVPPFDTPEGEVTVRGRIAPPPAHRLQLGPEAPGRIRQNLDLATLQRESGAIEQPLLVVEDAPLPGDVPTADGLVRHWPAPTVTVDRNYGYAAQWFAMSAAALVLYLWLQFIRPRRGRAAP